MRTMVNLNYNYYGTKDTTLFNKGTLELDYKNYYSSLPFSWSVLLNTSILYDKNYYDSSSKYKLYSNLDFSMNINKYFSDSSDLFVFAEANAYKSSPYFDKHIGSDILGGLGIGRMIYATSFAKAIRVDEYLYSENLLKEHLTKEELIQLGNLIDRTNEFYTKFNEKGDVEFYNEIEKLLIGTGKLVKGNFDSHALLRTSEVLNREKINIRSFGWNGKAGLKYKISDTRNGVVNSNRYSWLFSFDFGYPFNLKTQFNHSTSYNTNFVDYHEVHTNSELTYELTNLIDLYLIYSFYSIKFLSPISEHTGKFGFNFYIENNINIGLECSLLRNIYPPSYNVSPTFKQLRAQVNLNLGYRIL